jgi:hypothetical protein
MEPGYKALFYINEPTIQDLVLYKWNLSEMPFSRRNSNGQKTHEKMLTISSNKGNAN